MPYNVLPRAEEDLEAIGDYIAEDNPARAQLSDRVVHATPLFSMG